MIRHNPCPDAMKPSDADIDLYAKALSLSAAPRATPVHTTVLNFIYWMGLLAVFAWFAAMSFDREFPIINNNREVVNPDRKVAQGERLLVRATKRRVRSCELTRRWSITDGQSRRYDYEPERFDAYGPVTPADGPAEVEVTGPVIPIDAAPGRGRWVSVLGWECNPLQRALGWSIVLVQPAIEFEIIPRR